MKQKLYWILAFACVMTGLLGYWTNNVFLASIWVWYVVVGFLWLGHLSLKLTYYKSGTAWVYKDTRPQKIKLTLLDYPKAFLSWLNAFTRTFAIEPGLYYTGQVYDQTAPLIVTSNYRLTLFTLLRHLKNLNVRILVIDTDGINVWCASGKQQFNEDEILKQVNRYGKTSLWNEEKPTLILPKLSLSGVKLQVLRQAGIRPVIGPIYAKDLPSFLENKPYKNQTNDKVHFGFLSRLFTWLPGFVQISWYFVIGGLIAKTFDSPILIWQSLIIVALITTLYPLAFPLIPGKRFAVKGIWLAGFISVALLIWFLTGKITLFYLITLILFAAGTSMIFGLSYTGNSAVSAYTRVRRETAKFLPVTALVYAVFIVMNITYWIVQ